MYLDTILQPVLRHLTSHSISPSSDQVNQWREWRRLCRWFNSTHTNSSFSHPHFKQCFGLLNELLYDSEIWQKDFARMGPIFHGIGSVCHWLLFTYWTKYARIPFDLHVSLDILAVARLSGLALCAWSDPRRVIWTLYHNSVHFHAITGHDFWDHDEVIGRLRKFLVLFRNQPAWLLLLCMLSQGNKGIDGPRKKGTLLTEEDSPSRELKLLKENASKWNSDLYDLKFVLKLLKN